MKSFLFILFLGLSLSISAQLNLSEIMSGQSYVGHLPQNPFWSYDGKSIYFSWQRKEDLGASLYAYNYKNKAISRLDSTQISRVIEYDASQHNFKVQYFESNTTLAALYKINGDLLPCYQSNNGISNIQRLNDPNKIIFQQELNLLEWENKEGKSSLKQRTNFFMGLEKTTTEDTSFLSKQQAELFEYFKDRKKRKNWAKLQGNVALFPKPKANYLGEGNLSSLNINPMGSFVALVMSKEISQDETKVAAFVTENGQVQLNAARSKVSFNEPNQRLAILSLATDSLKWIDFSKLSSVRKKPSYLDTLSSSYFEMDRSIFIHPLKFDKSTNFALGDLRSADNKDRWIVLIDLEKGCVEELNHQHDDAWIGGPGISSWNEEVAVLDWFEDGKSFYFQSEHTGFSHLYLFDLASKQISALTSGNFEVYGAQLSIDKKRFYISANKTHAGNRDFYHLDSKSLEWTTILSADGYHDVQVSPDEKSLVVRYSNANTPWELYTAPNEMNAKMLRFTYSTTPKFQSYAWRKPPVIQFVASDSVKVAARIYNPERSVKNGAAVLFVHGAGYLQNAHNYWSNYYREYMFHNLLCDLGYTVLDVDYRASEGYGRDYRTAIYRFMGGRDLEDFIDAKECLVQNYAIDSNRIGIYGGSYGGFITLMGLLTKPNEFACGAALRAVTDWAHYNHEYTSNILNYPQTDPAAYRKSSPIYYAKNLSKPLLILHGMVDDNVQFQDVVRLSQRFIEYGKKDWELAVYPVEAHGFSESYSWQDEYRRIFELFEKHLKN